jgi:hypothetical protein
MFLHCMQSVAMLMWAIFTVILAQYVHIVFSLASNIQNSELAKNTCGNTVYSNTDYAFLDLCNILYPTVRIWWPCPFVTSGHAMQWHGIHLTFFTNPGFFSKNIVFGLYPSSLDQWSRLALSKGPHRVGAPLLPLFTWRQKQSQLLERYLKKNWRWIQSKNKILRNASHHRKNHSEWIQTFLLCFNLSDSNVNNI